MSIPLETPRFDSSDTILLSSADPRPAPPSASPAAGRRALGLALIAVAGALLAVTVLGVSIGPMEAEHGRTLADTPGWYQAIAAGLGGSLLLWSALGATGLALGIRAVAQHRGRGSGIAAIVVAVAGPVLVTVAFIAALVAGVGGL